MHTDPTREPAAAHRPSLSWPSRSLAVLASVATAWIALCSPPGPAAAEAQSPAAKAADDLRQLADELDAAERQEKQTGSRSRGAERAEPQREPRPAQGRAAPRLRTDELVRQLLLRDAKWQPTHEQIARLEIGCRLNNFCLDLDGRLLACCGDRTVRVLSQAGELLETWQLPFVPEAIGVRRADGAIFVGGQGQLARLSAEGSVQEQRPFPPPMAETQGDEAVDAQVRARQKLLEDRLRGLRAQLLELEADLPDEARNADASADRTGPSPNDPLDQAPSMSAGEDGFRLQFKEGTPPAVRRRVLLRYIGICDRQYRSPESLAASIRARMVSGIGTPTCTGIAVADQDLFVICAMPGHSYGAWRLNHDLGEEVLLVTGLRGCCGQMDCQTPGGDLWIPVNTLHQVHRYDRDGKLLGTFGRRAPAAEADGFGGCCEPKNMRFGEDGSVYCAESGPPVCVKRFTLDGQFREVVCFPVFESPCARVAVDVCGDRLFLMGSGENAIYVFAPKPKKDGAGDAKPDAPMPKADGDL